VPEPNQDNTSSGVQKYMAIKLVNNTTSRADYSNGDDDEYTNVDGSKIVFFFFNADGSAFIVDDTQAADDQKSYIENTEFKTWTTNDEGNNVTGISNILAVFSKKQGETPSKVIAVLNYQDKLENNKYTLDQVKALVTDAASVYTNDGKRYFTMSNSVYKEDAGIVTATDIPAASLAVSAEAAEDNPVQIYVERVVAKVSLTNGTGAGDNNANLIAINKEPTAYANGDKIGDLYVRIDGWQVYNNKKTTNLIKNIDGLTDSWVFGTNRSFWAVTPAPSDNKYEDAITSTISWNTAATNQSIVYPYENTWDVADQDYNTSVIFATTIVDKDNNPVDLTLWLSKYYTQANLKIAVANYLANSLYSYDEATKTWTSITPADLEFEETAAHAYSLIPKLANAESKWYAKNSTDALESDAVSAILAAVPKAQIWNGGKSYYFTPIKHTIGEFSQAGIVRNHWYQLKVNSITGLGTPVFDPDTAVDPENPTSEEYQEWYLDAQINILSWRIIAQKVDLE
jgi:hypothetical protein